MTGETLDTSDAVIPALSLLPAPALGPKATPRLEMARGMRRDDDVKCGSSKPSL